MTLIRLPSNTSAPDGIWRPRAHQQRSWDYLQRGGKRLVEVDHRRAGKDELALAWSAVAMHQEKPIAVWHMLPEASQARKAIWTALDSNRGRKRIDLAFPAELRETTRDQEMFIQFKSGSTWQVVGSDNFDSLVGSQPTGIVFSEFALANPYAWSYLRPILLENGGWAIFISTTRGRNHLHKLYQYGLREDNDWLSVLNRADETGVFTPAQLAQERDEYINQYGEIMGQSLFNQEYLCDWAAAWPGAYWGHELDALERDGRLTDVPYDPELPVVTSDDLGVNDANVTFYWQQAGAQVRMIDVDVFRNVGLQTHMKAKRDRPYKYSQSIYPHDIKVRELGTDGRSRLQLLKKLGSVHPTVAPSLPVQEGIDAFRRMIPRLWIDRKKCGEAFEILKSYRAEWDEKTQTLGKHPKHDHSSNFADSCRYFAITPIHNGEWSDLDYSQTIRAAI
jgi:phage terminase large subunit